MFWTPEVPQPSSATAATRPWRAVVSSVEKGTWAIVLFRGANGRRDASAPAPVMAASTVVSRWSWDMSGGHPPTITWLCIHPGTVLGGALVGVTFGRASRPSARFACYRGRERKFQATDTRSSGNLGASGAGARATMDFAGVVGPRRTEVRSHGRSCRR